MRIYSSKPSIVYIDKLEHNDKISSQYYSVDYIELEKKLLLNNVIQFKEIIKEYNGGPMGFQLHTYDYKEFGVPVLRTKDMEEMSIQLEDPIFISKEKNDELKNSITYSGDLVISKTGQIGVCSLVPSTVKKANLNQALCNIRVYESKIDKYFLVVFLNTKYGQFQLLREGQGKAVQAGLTREEIYSLKIPSISPEIQKQIGDKVRKAEGLREEAKRFEKEIKTVFDVEFDGINRSINESKVYYSKYIWKSANSIRALLNAEYFTLVGDRYEQIIKEQQGVYIDDLLKDCFMGKSPSQYTDIGVKILKVKNLTNSGLDWSDSDFVSKDYYVKNKKYHLQHGDVFIIPAAHLAKYIGEKVEVYINGVKGISYPEAMASGKIIVIRPDFEKVNPIYLCLVMREKFVYHQIQRQISGITASYYPKNVRELCIPLIERQKQDILADKYIELLIRKEKSKQLIQQAKQDVEDLIEGNFDMSKLNVTVTEGR